MNSGNTASAFGAENSRKTATRAIATSVICETTAATGALVWAETQIGQVVADRPSSAWMCIAWPVNNSTANAMQATANHRRVLPNWTTASIPRAEQDRCTSDAAPQPKDSAHYTGQRLGLPIWHSRPASPAPPPRLESSPTTLDRRAGPPIPPRSNTDFSRLSAVGHDLEQVLSWCGSSVGHSYCLSSRPEAVGFAAEGAGPRFWNSGYSNSKNALSSKANGRKPKADGTIS